MGIVNSILDIGRLSLRVSGNTESVDELGV